MVTDKVTTNTFERHAQTALVLLLVALLLWVGDTTQTTAVSVAEMRVELVFLKSAIERPDSELEAANLSIADLRARMLILEGKNGT
jgi:hypothetical protein